MSPVRLIRDKAELSGTCYFEFLPGEYRGKCWNDQSVFLAEEVFGLFEPIFLRHEPQFDHYAFVSIARPTWELIIAELDAINTPVDQMIPDCRGSDLAIELAIWLREQLARVEVVSILGM